MRRRVPRNKRKRLAKLERQLHSGNMPPAAQRKLRALWDEISTLVQRIYVNSERDRALWATINSSPPTDDTMPAGTDSHWRVKSGKASGPPPPQNDDGAVADTTPIAPPRGCSLTRAEQPTNTCNCPQAQQATRLRGDTCARRQP
jgi:hypothetical protein